MKTFTLPGGFICDLSAAEFMEFQNFLNINHSDDIIEHSSALIEKEVVIARLKQTKGTIRLLPNSLTILNGLLKTVQEQECKIFNITKKWYERLEKRRAAL